MEISQVIRKPLITEKSTLIQEQGKYVFEIAKKANKVLVKEAVEKIFDVEVSKVNICWSRGSKKRFGPRAKLTPDIKKAIVTLKAGERIQLVEGL